MEENKKTYEELENIVSQLSAQNEVLKNKLSEINYANAFTRLEFLFKVLKNSSVFPTDFVDKCVGEVISMMTVPETNEEA